MWDIQCTIYGFFMSGDNPFSFSNAGPPICVGAEVLLSTQSPYDILFGPDEPGFCGGFLDAIKECLAAGSQREGAAKSSGVANAVASVGTGMSNMWQQLGAVMRGRQAQMSPA
jgi:hypothetical protein